MLIRKPKYFDEFKCIAGECPKTCCAGWAVVVDDSTCEKYNALEGALGQRIRSEMKEDDGDIIFPLRNGRCPFLNDANLCDIQAATNEEILCRTCRMFPRFEYEFGLTRETGLSLSCPEAARLIMRAEKTGDEVGSSGKGVNAEFGDGENVELIEEQTDEGITQYNDIDPEWYMELMGQRKKLFEFVRDEEYSLWEKIEKIVGVSIDLYDDEISEKKGLYDESPEKRVLHDDERAEKELTAELLTRCCLGMFSKLESIDDEWEAMKALMVTNLDKFNGCNACNAWKILENISEEKSEEISEQNAEVKREIENILFYYIYRYFLGSVLEDGCNENGQGANAAGNLMLGIFCVWTVVWAITVEKAWEKKEAKRRQEIAYTVSREVEHSQMNIDVVKVEMVKFLDSI